MRRLAHGLLGEGAAPLVAHPREVLVLQETGVAQRLDEVLLDLAYLQVCP